MIPKPIHKSLLLGVSILSLIIFQGCPEPDILLPGTISGIITNSQFGQEPISGATVSISGVNEQKQTGSDGRFEFMVESNTDGYTLRYSHPEFETDENADVKVEPGGVTVADVSLDPIVPITLNLNELNFGETTSESSFTLTSNRTAESGDLNFSIITTSEFIEVAPATGIIGAQNTEAISVTIDRAFLTVGALAEQIIINVPNRGSAILDVVGTISEPPEPGLGVEVPTLDFGANEVSRSFQIENTGGDTVRWSLVENIPWASVTPNSGVLVNEPDQIVVTVDRNGFDPGEYTQTLTINSDAGSEEVVLTMTINGSLLQISPSTLSFGIESVEESLSLKRVGQGTLNYEVQSDRSWLTVTPTSGSVSNETDFIIVTVDRTGLEFGNFEGRLAFNTDDGTQIVTATITIPDPNAPQLTVNPLTVDMGQDVASTVISVQNTGQGRLVWSASKSTSWLSSSKSSGELLRGEIENITLTANRSELTPDTYEDVLRFTSNGGPQNVAVNIEVANRPVLSVDKETLDFGREESDLSFAISNIGNGEMTWTVSTNQDWISLNPTSGLNTGTVNVTALREGLSFGSYSGQVDIESDGGVDVVLVEMDILPPNVSPEADFTLSSDAINVDQTLEVNAGSSSDEEDGIDALEVRWRFNSNESFTDWRLEKRATRAYETQGVKQITLEVRDTDGAISNVTKEVQVIENQPPNAVFSVDPSSGKVGETTFTVDATGSNDDIDETSSLQYRWRWDQGQSFTTWLTDNTNTHVYGTTGEKTITLQVLDSFGEIGSVSQTISVTEDVTEVEPNDVFTAANEIPLESQVFGNVGTEDDEEDWFKIRPSQNGRVRLTVQNTGSGDNAVLDQAILRDSELNFLTSATNGSSSNPRIDAGATHSTSWATVSKDQDYLIRVAANTTTDITSYLVFVNFEEIVQEDIGEPNGATNSATPVEVNESINAIIGFGGDTEDWYSFVAPSNGQAFLTVENLQEGTVNGTMDQSNLYTSGIGFITSATNGSSSNPRIEPGEIRNSSRATVVGGETYFIRCAADDGLDATFYRLQVNFESIEQSDVGEPNDESSSATNLVEGESVTATVGFGVDMEDWYSYTPTANGRLFLTVENLQTGTVNGTLDQGILYTSSISFITSATNGNSSNPRIEPGEVRNSSIATVSSGNTYFIRIAPDDGLDATFYRVLVTLEEIGQTDLGEPNDDASQATAITIGESVTALIGFSGDGEDWYVVTPSEDIQITVSVENLQAGTVNGTMDQVILYDVNLNFLTSASNGNSSNPRVEPGSSHNSAAINLTAGTTYYVRVAPDDGLDATFYRLVINEN